MNNNANDRKNRSAGKHAVHPVQQPERLLPPRGDYQTLLSFQKAEVVYDITVRFAHKFLSKGDRTIDQQLIRLQKDFLQQGGLRERMTRLRLQYRNKPPQT